ncbi:MAG: type 1 glutamine amidotransferase [Flavobacteriaceae bacterium]
MKLLIVEGNNEETRVLRETFGIEPYHLLFQEMLQFLVPDARTAVAFPADSTKDLPTAEQLRQYDGILWTGSSLSVIDDVPAVTRQLNFAETIFNSGTPLYGSCWGLQVATIVAGGKVAKSKNLLEIGISKPIQLTSAGKRSPFFKNRNNNYKALCIHYDEVTKNPKDAIVLAYNEHSKVQAMVFDYKKTSFFGIQYHPEFKSSVMALIISFLSEKLVNDTSFASLEKVDELLTRLSEHSDLPPEITNYTLHTQEIKAWLNHIAQ